MIKTSKSIVLLTIVALFFLFNDSSQFKNDKNIIREDESESVKPVLNQVVGNNNNNNNNNNRDLLNKLKTNTKQSSSEVSSNKMNTNKEFVFGEDDDDEDDEKLDKIETLASDMNSMVNSNNPIETEMTNEESSSDETIDSDEQNVLKRSQRVDNIKHLTSNDKKLPSLLKFNKMDDLKKKLLELSDNKNNFDYDILIDDDFYEANKKKLLKANNDKKAKTASLDSLETDDDDDDDDDDLEDDESDTITIEDLLKQLETRMKGNEKAKFAKPTLKIKEQIYLEGVYNNNNNNNNNKQNTKQENQNSFFNSKNEMEIEREFSSQVNDDLKENTNQLNNNQTSSHVNSNPSYKMRNENQHESVDSKFEMIKRQNDYLFLFVVAGCTIAGVLALLAASVCWYTVAKSRRVSKGSNLEFENSKHSIFGNQHTGSSSVSGSIKSKGSNSSGDKKLALSAQMYHFQHQKEQIIAMEKANSEARPDDSDNSDDETPEGDYTVYECPGLAPTGEMEVKNPLFKEDFSASTNSLSKGSQAPPPSYSTVALSSNIVNETQQTSSSSAEQIPVDTPDQPKP